VPRRGDHQGRRGHAGRRCRTLGGLVRTGRHPGRLQPPRATAGAGQTVAIVDAYDNPNAEADLAVYRDHYGLAGVHPPATGAPQGEPERRRFSSAARDNAGGRRSPSRPRRRLLHLPALQHPAPRDQLGELRRPRRRRRPGGDAGANAISNSYGGSEWSSQSSYGAHYSHAGVAVTRARATGATAFCSPPLGKRDAVGGTSLTKDSSIVDGRRRSGPAAAAGARATSPSRRGRPTRLWHAPHRRRRVRRRRSQHRHRRVQQHGSGGAGNWYQFGGTSLSAPIIASVYAMAANPAANRTASYLYSHPGSSGRGDRQQRLVQRVLPVHGQAGIRRPHRAGNASRHGHLRRPRLGGADDELDHVHIHVHVHVDIHVHVHVDVHVDVDTTTTIAPVPRRRPEGDAGD